MKFIKIDIEGFELEALYGARNTLEKFKPIVYCEANHWCLNIFHRIPLPSFIEQLYGFFPHIFAVNSDGRFLDLSNQTDLYWFFHDHTVHFRYINLLCGFDKAVLLQKLLPLEGHINLISERDRLNAECAKLRAECDKAHQDRIAIVNSRSYKLFKRFASFKQRFKFLRSNVA